MVNIAMIGHKRIPSREGGIEIVVDELATRMAAKGHKVIAYNRKGHNVAGAEFDGNVHSANKPFVYNGVRVVPVPTFEAKGFGGVDLLILCDAESHCGQTGRDPLSCRRSLRHAASGALGGHSHGSDHSRS